MIPRKDFDALIDINIGKIYVSENESFEAKDLVDKEGKPLKHPELLLEEMELKLLIEPVGEDRYVLTEHAHKIMQKGGWLHLVGQLREPSSPKDYGKALKEEFLDSFKAKGDKRNAIGRMAAVAFGLLILSILVVVLMGRLAQKGFMNAETPQEESREEHLENRLKQLEDSLERVQDRN